MAEFSSLQAWVDSVEATALQYTHGWFFAVVHLDGTADSLHPTMNGSMSFDLSRDVRRTISKQVLLPAEQQKIDVVQDELWAFWWQGETSTLHPMGAFRAAELSMQKAVTVYTDRSGNVTSDLWHVAWGDRFLRLRASDGAPQTVLGGVDPTVTMAALLDAAGLPYAIAGAVSPLRQTVTWDGDVTVYAKVSELAEVAGHRPPWADNEGLIRSVLARTDLPLPIDLAGYEIRAETVAVTENYLTAPNRVIVTDSTGGGYAIRGQWDAPATAPHSFARRGYYLTLMVDEQGLDTAAHAQAVAETIGEGLTARVLDFELVRPTPDFDGPVILSYLDALWLVESWDIALAPGGGQSVTARELIL